MSSHTSLKFSDALISPFGNSSDGGIREFDWIKKGAVNYHFKYPPQIEELEPFNADLKDVIRQKLQECFGRQDELKRQHMTQIKKIIKTKPRSMEKWFLKEFDLVCLTEYVLVHKWINYWVNLWNKITDYKTPLLYNRLGKFEPWEIQQAKNFPIEQLFPTELKKVGIQFMGSCPFHKENTPSFSIKNNRGKCFGCGWSGDSIKFLMDLKNLNFPEAIRELI